MASGQKREVTVWNLKEMGVTTNHGEHETNQRELKLHPNLQSDPARKG